MDILNFQMFLDFFSIKVGYEFLLFKKLNDCGYKNSDCILDVISGIKFRSC